MNGCQTISRTEDALGQVAQLVPCQVATIVSNGNGILVDRFGAQLLSNTTGLALGPLVFTAGAGVVSQGGGNVVAAGGGH